MSEDTGIAIRIRDGCGLLQECGTAGTGYVSCCPEETTCVEDNDNIYCCAKGEHCAAALDEAPRCADTDWGLYNNHYWDGAPGYFCCAGDLRGYNHTTEFSNGCAESDADLPDDEEWLPLVEQVIPSSTDVATSTGTSATATATTTPEPDDDGGTNVGAIAGGVVGGVAGLAIIGAAAWWFLRKRRRGAAAPVGAAGANKPEETREMDATEALKTPVGPPRELDATPRGTQPSEMPT